MSSQPRRPRAGGPWPPFEGRGGWSVVDGSAENDLVERYRMTRDRRPNEAYIHVFRSKGGVYHARLIIANASATRTEHVVPISIRAARSRTDAMRQAKRSLGGVVVRQRLVTR